MYHTGIIHIYPYYYYYYYRYYFNLEKFCRNLKDWRNSLVWTILVRGSGKDMKFLTLVDLRRSPFRKTIYLFIY